MFRVCSSSVLHVYGCVLCFFFLWFVYMCVRIPSSPRSIAGVSLGQVLPGFHTTAHHLCAFLLYLEG